MNVLIENEQLLQVNIENEIKYLLINYKQTIDLENFLRYFKKYAKSPVFLQMTENLCTISEDPK